MKRLIYFWIAVTLLVSFVMTPAAATPVVFYIDGLNGPTVNVGRINSDGTNHQVLYSNAGGIGFGIDVDPVNQHIYWTEFANSISGFRIRRANFDGTGIVDLVTPSNDPDLQDITGLSLDLPNGKMYWVQRSGGGNFSQGKIKRADLSGANISTVLANLNTPRGIEVDSVSTGKIYFGLFSGSQSSRDLVRTDLNGANQQVVFTAPLSNFVNGVTVDPDLNNPKVYFTTEKSGPSGDVYSANPDGTNVSTLPVPPATGLLFGIDVLPTTNALDPLFWAQKSIPKLHQSLTDGSQYQVLLNTPLLAGDVAVVVIPEPASAAMIGLGSLLLLVRRKASIE